MGDKQTVDQHQVESCQSPKRREAWTMEKRERSKPPNLDLYNFEDPEHENGKYVLTSPRSLDACSALGIKPVELLYRPLIDVQEELLPRGLPMRTIYSVYEQTERERQNVLALCREQRQRLIGEDEAENGRSKKRVTIKEHASDSADSGTEVDQEDVDSGSLQRRRTAWTTRIGHERITRDELEKRAQDLHARALALRQATLSMNNTSKTKLKKKAAAKRNVTGGKSGLIVTGKTPGKSVNFKTGLKTKNSVASVGKKLRKKHRHGDSTERTPSVSDLSVTSTRSSRSPWLRDPTVDAKPISDPILRNKLKSARSPGARVSSRDQKILELMMAKREEEKAAEAKRQIARRAWEAQKQQEEAVKTTSEVRRRESLVKQRQREKELHKSRRHSESTDSLHSTYSERRDDDDDRRDCDDAHKYKDRQWSSQSQKIAELRSGVRHNGVDPSLIRYRSEGDMRSKVERPWVTTSHALMLKEKKMAERRLQNLQRKKSQEDKKKAAEDRIAMQKREEEDMAKLVLERQERELKRANSMKEAKEQEQLMQRKLKNYYQKKRHEERVTDMKRKSREDLNTLQSAIDMKQATAQSHLTAMEARRYNELRKSTRSGSMTDLDTRISRSKENQQRLQEELASWHDDLHKYSKMMEKRAEEQAKLAVEQKAKRAAEDRRQKERLQKKNFKKLLAQEEEWKADVEATIAMKDAKARMLQMEKEETVQESRAMAAASQRMREELRSAYSSDTIDQLSRQAQLQAKLGLETNNVNAGLAGSTKNMSTLTLG